jgi:hypothetical protein
MAADGGKHAVVEVFGGHGFLQNKDGSKTFPFNWLWGARKGNGQTAFRKLLERGACTAHALRFLMILPGGLDTLTGCL